MWKTQICGTKSMERGYILEYVTLKVYEAA